MERVWGGRRLESEFGKKLPPQRPVGESWEIVDRPEAQSIVRNGPLRGKTLHELWTQYRDEIFGDVPDSPRFPLLLKLLDAHEKLSLQVHPPAKFAKRLGGEPKTEFWYVVAADPGAEIYLGFRESITRERFEKALTIADELNHKTDALMTVLESCWQRFSGPFLYYRGVATCPHPSRFRRFIHSQRSRN